MSHRRIIRSAGYSALWRTANLDRIKDLVATASTAIDTLEAIPEADREKSPELGAVVEALNAIEHR